MNQPYTCPLRFKYIQNVKSHFEGIEIKANTARLGKIIKVIK